MKKIFVIDWIMFFLFFGSFFTGIKLHAAGHIGIHEIWHNWAVSHILVNLLFLSFGIWHIKLHQAWYKSLVRKGFGNRSKITLVLSVIFLFVTLTSLPLLGIEGAGSEIGLWHYASGMFFGLISILHIGKRISKIHIKRSPRSN